MTVHTRKADVRHGIGQEEQKEICIRLKRLNKQDGSGSSAVDKRLASLFIQRRAMAADLLEPCKTMPTKALSSVAVMPRHECCIRQKEVHEKARDSLELEWKIG